MTLFPSTIERFKIDSLHPSHVIKPARRVHNFIAWNAQWGQSGIPLTAHARSQVRERERVEVREGCGVGNVNFFHKFVIDFSTDFCRLILAEIIRDKTRIKHILRAWSARRAGEVGCSPTLLAAGNQSDHMADWRRRHARKRCAFNAA